VFSSTREKLVLFFGIRSRPQSFTRPDGSLSTPLISAGVSASMRVSLTVGSTARSLSEALTYDEMGWLLGRTAGNYSNGPLNSSAPMIQIVANAFRVGIASAKSSIGSTDCEFSEWMSDTAVACRVSYSWSGLSRSIVMTAGIRADTSTETFSFDGALLQSLAGHRSLASMEDMVTMIGSELGVMGLTDKARVGVTACEATEWKSTTFQ